MYKIKKNKKIRKRKEKKRKRRQQKGEKGKDEENSKVKRTFFFNLDGTQDEGRRLGTNIVTS